MRRPQPLYLPPKPLNLFVTLLVTTLRPQPRHPLPTTHRHFFNPFNQRHENA
jgi:hypothetical protein